MGSDAVTGYEEIIEALEIGLVLANAEVFRLRLELGHQIPRIHERAAADVALIERALETVKWAKHSDEH